MFYERYQFISDPLFYLAVILAAIVTIVLLYKYWTRIAQRWQTALRIELIITNKFFSYFPHWFYIHSVLTRFLAAGFAFVIFIPLTDEWIVNVTAAYATLLLLDSILTSAPLLRIKRSRDGISENREFDSELFDGDADEPVFEETITIENIGGKKARNPQIWYHVTDSSGERIKSGEIRHNSGVEKGDKIFKDIPIAGADKTDEKQAYYVKIKAQPDRQSGFLQTRNIKKLKADTDSTGSSAGEENKPANSNDEPDTDEAELEQV